MPHEFDRLKRLQGMIVDTVKAAIPGSIVEIEAKYDAIRVVEEEDIEHTELCPNIKVKITPPRE